MIVVEGIDLIEDAEAVGVTVEEFDALFELPTDLVTPELLGEVGLLEAL